MEQAHAPGHADEAPEGHHTSIFPFVVALSAGFGFGGLAFHSFLIVAAGVALLAVGVGGWLWQDAAGISFALRGRFEDRPFESVSVRKLGMWIFLVTEIFFFTGLIAAGLALRVRVPLCAEGVPPVGACWPSPASADFPLNIPITAINTFVLIVSSFTMAEAVHAAQLGNQSRLKAYLAATLILGGTFVGIQVYEYTRLFAEGLTPWPNAVKPWLGTFGTAFFAQTGFHGAHVTGGLLGLLFLNVKAWRQRASAETVEIIGLYWHFVDIVWIFLFPIMYLIGR
ncbi:MAG TPA: heme-copper oxidase subunit III [Thermoplasmata archaeon]|jgi:heme/copper-type cytochrome/quinol oxidase subunit 3|nr:heme-copper oxidase subunit III [Thermoplasmata archaeon]